MFNYNTIKPVNIHYRKYPNTLGTPSDEKKEPLNPDENKGGGQFPNGNKVAIDYTNNKINISQVLQDFRSTIAAINSPDEIKNEVEEYLKLVEKETLKNSPSREIVLSDLKNAARITDKYIQDSLKKPSKVVQDWVEALFLQNINLKADPNEINEDFRVKIPEKKPQPSLATTPVQIEENSRTDGIKPLDEDTVTFTANKTNSNNINKKTEETTSPIITDSADNIDVQKLELEIDTQAKAEYQNETSATQKTEIKPLKNSLYAAKTENETLAKEKLIKAKDIYKQSNDIYNALKLYDEALELISTGDNQNLKSAIYFERAKIFDLNDYAELALIDYHKATKSSDNNLKTHAHIKMGDIYDEYVQFDPAMNQYTRAIESAEEVNNYQGKTKALRQISSMFARMYDKDNLDIFAELALDSARESNNPKTIKNTYFETAKNYQYIGEDSKALKVYAEFAKETSHMKDYDSLAQDYMEASILMDKKGNKKKANSLMQKAKEYRRLAKLKQADLA